MTYTEARCFAMVVEQRSITKAAQILNYTQPYISKIIARAEAETGCVLLNRSRHSCQPTSTGLRYLEYCQRILALHQEFQEEFHPAGQSGNHRIVIGVPPTRGSYLLQLVLGDFQAACPRAHVTVVEAHSKELPGYIEKGTVDMAAFSSPTLPAGISCEAFLDDRILMMIPPGHPLYFHTDCKQYTVPILEPHMYQLLEHSSFVSADTPRSIRMLNYLETLGIRCRDAIRTRNALLTHQLCEQGLGIAAVMEVTLHNITMRTVPCLYQIGTPPLKETWYVAWQKQKVLTPAMSTLAHLIKERGPALIANDFHVSP